MTSESEFRARPDFPGPRGRQNVRGTVKEKTSLGHRGAAVRHPLDSAGRSPTAPRGRYPISPMLQGQSHRCANITAPKVATPMQADTTIVAQRRSVRNSNVATAMRWPMP
jgi:hypothetical protein